MDNKTEFEKLTKQREHAVTRIFWFGLEIALVFAIPAAIGAWIGLRLGGGAVLFIILGATFIFSWTIVVFRYKQVAKKMQYLDTRIKELKTEISQEK